MIPTRERLAALLLALVPALAPALALAQEDPTVVQVGKVSYPLSVVSFSLQSALDLAQSLGEVTQEDVQTAKEETIERFIGMGIIENQLMRAGRNDFSDSEKELLMAQPAISMSSSGRSSSASFGRRARTSPRRRAPSGWRSRAIRRRPSAATCPSPKGSIGCLSCFAAMSL